MLFIFSGLRQEYDTAIINLNSHSLIDIIKHVIIVTGQYYCCLLFNLHSEKIFFFCSFTPYRYAKYVIQIHVTRKWLSIS